MWVNEAVGTVAVGGRVAHRGIDRTSRRWPSEAGPLSTFETKGLTSVWRVRCDGSHGWANDLMYDELRATCILLVTVSGCIHKHNELTFSRER